MKKIIAITLCLAFLFGLNTIVYAQDGQSEASSTEATSEPAPTEDELEMWGNAKTVSDDFVPIETLNARNIVSGDRYYIVNANSNKLLNVANGSTASGSNVVQWWNTGEEHNEWEITQLADGYYEISPCHAPNTALDILNNGTADGDNVGIFTKPASGTYNSSKWSISQVSSTKNYKIASMNSGGSKVLTVQGASYENGANVFMYSYSSGRPTNDEWIFIPVDSINLVEIGVHQDKSYLTTFGSQPSNINQTMADVGKPFYTNWGISVEPFYYNVPYMPLQDCSFAYNKNCETTPCGSTCQNAYELPNHHKNFDYNAYDEWSRYGDDGKDLRLVVSTGAFCHMSGGSHSTGPLGMVNGIGSKDAMVFNNRGYMLNVRVIQHEMSHNFGCGHCDATAASERCIMDSGFDNDPAFNLPTIWCSTCEIDFDKYAH